MLNKDKYIGRSPALPIADKVLESSKTVGDSIKIYSTEEAALNIMDFKCRKQRQKLLEATNLGCSQFLPSESLKELLSLELKKSRFVAFKEKFSEDMFFKKPALGQALELKSKPENFTNENFTYGLKNSTSEIAYELICPNKNAHQVKQEYLSGHDKYLLSHKHYLPAERVTRNYNENFNPYAAYGISYNVDKTGQMVKKCLQHCDRKVLISKAQKDFKDRTLGQLGKKIDRYNLNLDPQQTFGIKTKNYSNCDVRSLIENDDSRGKNTSIIEAISYINKLRRTLFNHNDFHINDLKTLLNTYDENETKFINFKMIMKILRSLRIYANEEKILLAVKHFKILKDEKEISESLIDVEKFWKMLHIQYPLPRNAVLSDLPKGEAHKQTTYRLLCCDREKSVIAENRPKLYKLSDDFTRASDLIAPDITLHYGLSSSDFEVIRPKEELRRIFTLLLPQNFEQVWQFALSKQCGEDACKMSVNNFRAAMQDYKQN